MLDDRQRCALHNRLDSLIRTAETAVFTNHATTAGLDVTGSWLVGPWKLSAAISAPAPGRLSTMRAQTLRSLAGLVLWSPYTSLLLKKHRMNSLPQCLGGNDEAPGTWSGSGMVVSLSQPHGHWAVCHRDPWKDGRIRCATIGGVFEIADC